MSWDDAAGDVLPLSNEPERPRLDVVQVEARGEKDALRLKVRLKDSLERHFAYRRPEGGSIAGVVATFYLDTDNNPQTGGGPRGAEGGARPVRGYEYQVSVQLGWRYGDGQASGTATGDAVIDPSKYKVVEPLAVFALAKFKQGTGSLEFPKLPEGSRERAFKATSWKGDTVEAAVPYEWLGVKAGDTVRLCFYERGTADHGYSEDRLLKLGP